MNVPCSNQESKSDLHIMVHATVFFPKHKYITEMQK